MSKKYIFITGGASGMGKSTVQLFIDKGWFVGCYDINKNNLNALEEENKKLSPLRDKKMESAAKLQKLNLDISMLSYLYTSFY